MTSEEKQEIIAAVLSAIKTNSALITDLTEVTTVPDDGYIEFSGGRRIKGSTLQSIIQTAIANNVVAPSIASEASTRESADTAEKSARETADTALQASITALQTICTNLDTNKFAKANVVQETGTSTDKVMSQNAVTTQLTTLDTNMKKVKLSVTHPSETKFTLTFVNSAGTTTTFDINGASDSYAGLLTAEDYTMIHEHATTIADLVKEKITAINVTVSTEDAEIEVVKNGSDSLKATIPQSSTTKAGLMTASQFQDLEALIAKNYPLYLESEESNAGDYEYGAVIEPTIKFKVMRRGEDVYSDATITGGNSQLYDEETGLVTVTSVAAPSDFSVALNITQGGDTISRTYAYKYKHYIYGTAYIDGKVEDPTSLIGSGCSLCKLSNDTTLGETKLQVRQCYIFAVPGNVKLVVREASTGGIIEGCTTGTLEVARQCDPETTDTYSYVIVPGSVTNWSFKITNS